MKKILIPIGALLISGLSQAQLTNTENYVYTKTYLDYNGTTAIKTSESIQYFDGLGRPKQVVNVKASPTGKDVVTHIEYDGFGRQVKDYLPVPQQGTQNGAIYTSPLSNATQQTLYGSERIFSEKILESSPLNRILQQKQVGNAWNDKPVQFGYDANTTADAVKKYNLVTTWENGATKSEFIPTTAYAAAQLYKNTVTDEDGNQTIEFKNGEGQVVLVRKMLSATEKVDTYYVYNEFNQLAYVIPPLAAASGATDETTLNNLCYQYKYDGRNRLVEKKLPGKGWEFMVYNNADRLIMSQDANMRTSASWAFTKYDKFGAVAYTGISTTSLSRQSLQTNASANSNVYETRQSTPFTLSGMAVHYSNVATPVNVGKILSVNYYDTYPAYTFTPPFPTSILGETTLSQTPTAEGLSTKSLPVLSLVKNIEDDNWTKNYTYYDKKGRVIGSYSINHLGGRTKVESKLDFAGAVQQTVTRHKRLDTDTDKVITENFTYDSQNRLLTHTHQVDNNPVEYLAQNTYNELSQLSGKKVGGASPSTPLQDISYKYNIRGWMTQINDPNNLGGDLFGYKINYNQVEGLETPNSDYTDLKVKPKYNGNIAEISWKTSSTDPNDYIRRYGYVYDHLNRLSAGFYQRDDNPSAKEYFEKMDYDLNGNILRLKRSAAKDGNTTASLIDDLTYVYAQGNRLASVTDAASDYRGYPDVSGNTINYDLNGNMTNEKDKGILNIDYNFLNLPGKLTFDQTYVVRNISGSTETRNITTKYLYRADGTKLNKTYTFGLSKNSSEISTITDYLDGFQYAGGGNTSTAVTKTLQFVPTTEGYYDYIKNKYIYNYVDHLGNVRLSYENNSNVPNIIDENNYYPFGLKHEGYNDQRGNVNYNNNYTYKYNGKELQTETGMYDYGARFYMPDLGRWGVVDPLAEKMTRHSPYNYAFNNPIRFIDPDGRDPIDYVNEKGKIIGTDGTDDPGVVMVTNKQDLAAIRSADKKGQGLPLNQLSEFNADMIVPFDDALKETLDVLDRGDANGGYREESSSFSGENNVLARGETGPLPTVDARGVGTASASIPINSYTHTTVHLHPAGIFEANGLAYPFDALTPTRGVDDKAFAGKGTNIIAGRLEVANSVIKNSNGTYNDTRPVGAAVYRGSNISKPVMILTKQVIKNILNRNGK